MSFRSAIYAGSVVHTRVRPVRHHLRYNVFWLLLDLDEIDALAERFRLFSHNRFNALSFFDRDHGFAEGQPLRAEVEGHLRAGGIEPDGGRIEMLCMPRVLGYGFNPLTVFFCRRRDGELAAILYEVHNTFGQRHAYLVAVERNGGTVRQEAEKCFYVSPFMDMPLHYSFRVRPPGERIAIAIDTSDSAGPLMTAALSGKRREISDGALLRLLAGYPLMTLKVVAAIHWQALLLWMKGMKLRPRPLPPKEAVTIGYQRGRDEP